VKESVIQCCVMFRIILHASVRFCCQVYNVTWSALPLWCTGKLHAQRKASSLLV